MISAWQEACAWRLKQHRHAERTLPKPALYCILYIMKISQRLNLCSPTVHALAFKVFKTFFCWAEDLSAFVFFLSFCLSVCLRISVDESSWLSAHCPVSSLGLWVSHKENPAIMAAHKCLREKTSPRGWLEAELSHSRDCSYLLWHLSCETKEVSEEPQKKTRDQKACMTWWWNLCVIHQTHCSQLGTVSVHGTFWHLVKFQISNSTFF